MMRSLFIALALTLLLELAFALVWGVRKDGLLIVALMNVMTNPAVNVLYALAVGLLGWARLPVTVLLEAAAVGAEGLCCRGMIRRPWLFAVLVNLFSFSMGELLKHLC